MDLVPKMPAFPGKQAQLSTEDANETRLVTSIRCCPCNAFHPSRLNNIEEENVIAQRMLDLVMKSNYLKVEENGWARKWAIWTFVK
ncbi:DDE Tnp4 domain-containing protein [Trichonephila clavipes]|nr:DDE Tnp4 domain-containing protein [Trichonephila clavipes]